MKMLLEGFQELDHAELIKVNGGYATIWAYTTDNTVVQNNGYSNAGSSSTGYLNVGSVSGCTTIDSVNSYWNIASIFTQTTSPTISSPTPTLEQAIDSNLGQQYIEGTNDCDVWAYEVMNQSGHYVKGFSNPLDTTCANHYNNVAAANSDEFYDSTQLQTGQYYLGINQKHAYLVQRNSDGTFNVAHQSQPGSVSTFIYGMSADQFNSNYGNSLNALYARMQ
jgi:hypothetical protein